MMKNKLASLVVALSLIGMAWTSPASAQTNLNNRTSVTFSQPVEVPGKTLPAGTYTFELNDSMANRHIVQIFDQGGTKLMATVLAVPHRRATATDDTVITFAEVPAGQPQAVRNWFYPGQVMGHEMVYSKTRALALAGTSGVTIPSVEDSFYANANVESMKTVEIVPGSATRQNTPATQTPATTPTTTPTTAPTTAPTTTPTTTPRTAPATTPMDQRTQDQRTRATTSADDRATATTPRTELPRTASTLPLMALVGFGTIALGMTMRRFARRRAVR